MGNKPGGPHWRCIDDLPHNFHVLGISEPPMEGYIILECKRCKYQDAVAPFDQESLR